MQTSTEDEADRLLRALVLIGRAAKRTLRGPMDGGGYWLLHVLENQGPMRLTDLAVACDLDNSTISRHARTLETTGWVARTPDLDDRRATLLAISPEGARALAEARNERRALITERLSAWSPDDVLTMTDLLSRLADELGTPPNNTRKNQ
ncbi:MarR family transcriptional regulator [Mariniluteicoccus endophyticus]